MINMVYGCVIVWFRPSCNSCIFRIFYFLFFNNFLPAVLVFSVVSSSMVLCFSGNREINMMMTSSGGSRGQSGRAPLM